MDTGYITQLDCDKKERYMSVTPKKGSGTTAVLDAPHRSKTREGSDIPARARKLAAEALELTARAF